MSDLFYTRRTKKHIDEKTIDLMKTAYTHAIINIFDKNDEDIILGQVIDYDGTTFSAGAYMESGFMEVYEGLTLCKTGTYTSSATFWDKNKEYISGENFTSGTITAPANAYYIRVGLKQEYQDDYMLLTNDYLIDEYIAYKEGIPKFSSRNWKNKKMCTLGHSLVQMERWQPTVVQQLAMDSYEALATSGGLLINEICYNIQDVSADNDLIVMWAGTNDWSQNKPIGSPTDTDETSTFYGALNYVIEYAGNNYPNKVLMFITDFIRDDQTVSDFITANGVDSLGNARNNNGDTLLDFVNAVKTACKNNGIPVFDNYNNSGINKYNIDTYSDDRLHHSHSGGKFQGKRIAKFINTL